jgi:hypothetical protein
MDMWLRSKHVSHPIRSSKKQTESVELHDEHYTTDQHYTLQYSKQPMLIVEPAHREKQISQTQRHQNQSKQKITIKDREIIGAPASYADGCTGDEQSC